MAPRLDDDTTIRRRWWEPLLVGVILTLALALRVYGWDWDEGHLFHPDERQIFMVVRGMSLPLPPTMCAVIPMLRIFSMGLVRGINSFSSVRYHR